MAVAVVAADSFFTAASSSFSLFPSFSSTTTPSGRMVLLESLRSCLDGPADVEASATAAGVPGRVLLAKAASAERSMEEKAMFLVLYNTVVEVLDDVGGMISS